MHVDLWFLLQVFITVLAALVLAVIFSLQEKGAETRALSETAILCSFLLDHHPSYKSIEAIADYKHMAVDADSDYLKTTKEALAVVRRGHTPAAEEDPERLKNHLKALLAGPLFVWIFIKRAYQAHRAYRLARLQHTESRRDDMSKLISVGMMTVVYFLLTSWIGLNTHGAVSVVAGLAAVILGITVGLALGYGAMIVYQQQQWKEFWSNSLTEIMVLASQAQDQGLFGRAAMLRSSVEGSEGVPLPGGIGFYTAVYAIAQGGVLLLERYLSTVPV
jgi:hypothetical protein